LGIVARDFQGYFLGAKCVVKRVVVDPKTAEAMAALWAVQFCKEVGFFEVLFEGDAAQVVADIKSKRPQFSKSGIFVESIRSEI
jgi:ribonuclease HI